jgi:hypothetical protein
MCGRAGQPGERCSVWTLGGRSEAKAVRCVFSGDEGRRLEDRERLETAVVPAVNDADLGGRVCSCGEIDEYVGVGDSMLARVKV